jgi:DNA-directed RNA polymerase-5 subunit 1
LGIKIQVIWEILIGIKTNGKPLNNLLNRLILHISENCKVAEHKKMDIQTPCLHFYLQGSDTSSANKNIWNTMIDEICPKLLDTVAKGDDHIKSISISWNHVNSASWVPLQICMIQMLEGEINVEATIDRCKVKQCGDAWKIFHDACLPIVDLLNTKRCIAYSIHEIYKCFIVSSAYYLLLQRLSFNEHDGKSYL